MDTSIIIKAAFSTVGTVQMLKNFINLKNKKLWVIPTVLFAVVYTMPFIPAWVLDAVLTVSGATLFYDTIVKSFEKIFTNNTDSAE